MKEERDLGKGSRSAKGSQDDDGEQTDDGPRLHCHEADSTEDSIEAAVREVSALRFCSAERAD
jgi:hypothetical protein